MGPGTNPAGDPANSRLLQPYSSLQEKGSGGELNLLLQIKRKQIFLNQKKPKTMKKSFLAIAIILGVASIILTSCNKDDVDPLEQWGGSYELLMDGKVVAEGDTDEIGMLGNSASASNGEEFGVLLANVPESSGGVTNIDDTEESGVISITGRNLLLNDGSDELYFATSGTIKRESATTITFEGTCVALEDASEHSFSGSMESKAFKLI
jgi:hypothetical protein